MIRPSRPVIFDQYGLAPSAMIVLTDASRGDVPVGSGILIANYPARISLMEFLDVPEHAHRYWQNAPRYHTLSTALSGCSPTAIHRIRPAGPGAANRRSFRGSGFTQVDYDHHYTSSTTARRLRYINNKTLQEMVEGLVWHAFDILRLKIFEAL